VSDHPVHRDDVTALRKEGDLPAYIRQLRAEGRARLAHQPSPARTPKRKKKQWGAIPIPPDHKPGQWPPGTSPPEPAPERSNPVWEAAERHYSNEINRPDQPCDCGNCTPPEPGEPT
jgi:hypothetical protein